MRTLICELCGKEFKTDAPNVKYCSDECSEKGAELKRKEWEERTNYKERQRIEKAKQRKAEQEKQRLERLEKRNKKMIEHDHNLEIAMKERKEKLKEKAEQGNQKAKLRLAKPFSYEYWEAYQAIETHEKDEETARFKRYVNGISVYDDDFIEKVLFTIEEKGVIFSELIEVKKNTNEFRTPETIEK